MFTTAAVFEARSAGRTALVRRIAAKRLSAKLSCHASSGIVDDPSRNARAPPALFTRMSRPPSAASACVAMVSTPSLVVTSPDTNVGPGIEKALRDSRADAARASGDQGTAAAEFFREIGFVGHGMFLRGGLMLPEQ